MIVTKLDKNVLHTVRSTSIFLLVKNFLLCLAKFHSLLSMGEPKVKKKNEKKRQNNVSTRNKKENKPETKKIVGRTKRERDLFVILRFRFWLN